MLYSVGLGGRGVSSALGLGLGDVVKVEVAVVCQRRRLGDSIGSWIVDRGSSPRASAICAACKTRRPGRSTGLIVPGNENRSVDSKEGWA